MPTRHSVTVGSARFSLLTPHLLRLQYAPFDDRRSMRVYSRPNAIPFEDVRQTDGGTELSSDHFTITYRAGEPFTPETLRVEWAAGGLSGVWDPSVKDAANLGGTFFSMDNINQDLVARGVPSAGLDEDLIEPELLYKPLELLTVRKTNLRQRQGGRYPLIRPMNRAHRAILGQLSEEGRQVSRTAALSGGCSAGPVFRAERQPLGAARSGDRLAGRAATARRARLVFLRLRARLCARA